MIHNITIGDLTIDCSNADRTREFYAKSTAQFGEDHYITMLDPDGHPFCLCRKKE